MIVFSFLLGIYSLFALVGMYDRVNRLEERQKNHEKA